jgi:hypothetical protein
MVHGVRTKSNAGPLKCEKKGLRPEAIMERSLLHLAKLLAVVSGDQLYCIAGYGSLAAYIRARRACWRISVRYAHQLIAAERWVMRVPRSQPCPLSQYLRRLLPLLPPRLIWTSSSHWQVGLVLPHRALPLHLPVLWR